MKPYDLLFKNLHSDRSNMRDHIDLMTDTVEVSSAEGVLMHARGNITEAANLLNVNRGTLAKIIKEKRPNVVVITRKGDYSNYKLLK